MNGGYAEDRLYADPDLAQFYDLDNGWGADLAWCAAFAGDARSVLDLGCGTGALAAALAADRRVAGADANAAMIDIARRRPGGDRVDWIVADARRLRLGRRFDLVLMTGHAFQVFVTRDDRAAVLRAIALHLEPGGRFVFDTRNPDREEWREWTPERSRRTLHHPILGAVEAWNGVRRDEATGIVTYETVYEVARTGRVHRAESRLAFPDRDEVRSLIGEAGLAVETWLGDWQGAPMVPSSPEIIPMGRRPA